MYLYKIGYGSYEESEYETMTFPSKLSEEELHQKVLNAIIKVLQGVLDGKYDDVYADEEGIRYESIHRSVVDELHNDGFKSVEYAGTWSCFGWPSLVSNISWQGQRGEILDRLFAEIHNDLKEKIIEFGTKQDQASREELREWHESHKNETLE